MNKEVGTETMKHKQDCLIAVTREVQPTGTVSWVVWHNNEYLSEEESEQAALNVARALISEGER